jgi:uncharacterized protein (TIGR03000 family)
MKQRTLLGAGVACLALVLAAASAEAQRRGSRSPARPNFATTRGGGNYWGWGNWGWGGAGYGGTYGSSYGLGRPSYFFSFGDAAESSINGDPGPGGTAGQSAHIRVLLPTAEALVLFDSHATKQKGTDREFETPPLPGGREATYTVTASWVENGRRVSRERRVTVRPGADVLVNFTGPPR